MKIIKKLIPLGLMAMPFAAGAVNVTSFDSLVVLVNDILGKLVPIFIATCRDCVACGHSQIHNGGRR